MIFFSFFYDFFFTDIFFVFFMIYFFLFIHSYKLLFIFIIVLQNFKRFPPFMQNFDFKIIKKTFEIFSFSTSIKINNIENYSKIIFSKTHISLLNSFYIIFLHVKTIFFQYFFSYCDFLFSFSNHHFYPILNL